MSTKLTAEELGQIIKAARVKLGMRGMQLAELVGCSKASISCYESGRMMPGALTLIAIVKALGLRLDLLKAPEDAHEATLCGQPKPTRDQIAWALEHIADHVTQGGSHRVLWNDRLGMPGMPTDSAKVVAESEFRPGSAM